MASTNHFSLVLFFTCLLDTGFVVSKGKDYDKEVQALLPDFERIAKSIDKNGLKTNLWTVGTYIAAHKYFGVDFRYLTGKIEASDQVFHKKFPSPILRDLHPTASKACESSAMKCVTEVVYKARQSGSLQHLMKSKEKLQSFAPFKNNYEEFKFRQTAMYYLCWHTQLEDEFLKFSSGRQSCLSYLNAVDEIPAKKRFKLVGDGTPAIEDIRDEDFRDDPFTCARLWFCPDPCYGRKDRGHFKKRNFKVEGNPCLELKNSECKWEKNGNINFKDLIRNRFNITCDCSSERKGFSWNSRFGMCVDTDECYDRTSNCPDNRLCKNTVGSFMCTCAKGYAVNTETDECEKTEILHESASMLSYKHFQRETDKEKGEPDFVLEMMDFVGLSVGNRILQNNLSFVLTTVSMVLLHFLI
ncbi:uncharacterized protein LOC132734012 [Ruditapes philippinarum]|uniref:uncharacterized protein LOC132734012 n=1 Tax=Ruditapes philippinarum TaxID=129788 RepID=UPI00295C1D9B|nr:uncharacterized protein LOC132734012 [Ruditapes philippinarum]